MIKFITKFRLKKTMFFVLVTAMLSMQWSVAHIHLAEHHDHDGSHHQHNIEGHAHQSFSHNDNFTDSIHQLHHQDIKLVELGHDCNVQSWNNIDDQTVVLTSVNVQLNFTTHINRITSAGFRYSKQRYLDYSTINLRAPPVFA